MSTIMYWRERLKNKFPLYNIEWVDTEYVRINEGNFPDVWPVAIAKQTFHKDYEHWFEKVYLDDYREAKYYQLNPDALPRPDDSPTFFTHMAPLLYIVGRKHQNKSYRIDVFDTFEGRTIRTRTSCNFIRLCPIDAHRAVFEQRTGIRVDAAPSRFNPHTDELVRRVRELHERKRMRSPHTEKPPKLDSKE